MGGSSAQGNIPPETRSSADLTAPMPVLVLPTSAFVERQLAALRAVAPDEEIFTDPASAPAGRHRSDARVPHCARDRLALSRAALHGLRGRRRRRGARHTGFACPRADHPRRRSGARHADGAVRRARQHCATSASCRGSRRSSASRNGQRPPPASRCEFAVGVMGFGSIGAPVVDVLSRWVFRSPSGHGPRTTLDGAAAYAGTEALPDFLARSRVLVCTLPLTPATRGILDAGAVATPSGAYVINVSRGRVLVEADLVTALDAGHLAGAALDVYATEPLPADEPAVAAPEAPVHAAHRRRAARRDRGGAVRRQPPPGTRRAAARQRRRSHPRLLGTGPPG